MKEREKLIEELEKRFYTWSPELKGFESHLSIEGVAEFILADRKRIVKGIVSWRKRGGNGEELTRVLDETLKLAGEI